MATYFWVGGAGTWNNSNTANWSLLSGGIGGVGPPISTDIVNFDTNSGSGTCTTAAGSACATATFNSATLGLTLGAAHTMSGTFTLTQGTLSLGSFALTCNVLISSNSNTRSIAFGTGNITLTGNAARILDLRTVTNLTVTGTPVINSTYAGSTGTRTIETGALPEAQTISVNVTAGTDIVTNASTGARFKNLNFTGFAGTFNAGNAQSIYGNLTLGSGMTVGASTVTLSFVGSAATQTITTNGVSVDRPINLAGVGSTFAFQDALTQGSTRAFTITNGTVQLKSGVTSTVGSLTTSSTTQKFLQSTLAGTQATLSQVTGTVSVGYLTIKDINATGGATFNAYTVNSNVNAGNNLGWDFFAQLGKTIFTRRKEKRVLI
jgi:hypothetical protein